jgi:hypothetical protein
MTVVGLGAMLSNVRSLSVLEQNSRMLAAQRKGTRIAATPAA